MSVTHTHADKRQRYVRYVGFIQIKIVSNIEESYHFRRWHILLTMEFFNPMADGKRIQAKIYGHYCVDAYSRNASSILYVDVVVTRCTYWVLRYHNVQH